MTLRCVLSVCLLLALAPSTTLRADDGRWKTTIKNLSFSQGVVEDTFTELQWTLRDNLRAINWSDAKAYCNSLVLNGGGWRLPSMEELSMLYSGAQGDTVPCGKVQCTAPKMFYLTSEMFWSGDPGESSSEAWLFGLSNGFRFSSDVSSPGLRVQALCVRRRS